MLFSGTVAGLATMPLRTFFCVEPSLHCRYKMRCGRERVVKLLVAPLASVRADVERGICRPNVICGLGALRVTSLGLGFFAAALRKHHRNISDRSWHRPVARSSRRRSTLRHMPYDRRCPAGRAISRRSGISTVESNISTPTPSSLSRTMVKCVFADWSIVRKHILKITKTIGVCIRLQ